MIDKIITDYNEAIYDTDKERALVVIEEAVSSGVTPEDVVFKVIIPAMEQMIKSMSEDFDANLAQHFMTSQIAAEATERMVARFKQAPVAIGRVVIGTSFGDLHSLGKKIVTGCLKSMMVDVIDVGTNVVPERFVDEAVANNASVIAISSMMLHTAKSENGCKKVRQILRERGLEGKIKLVVGGAPYRFDPGLYKSVGADAWAPDGVTGAKAIAELLEGIEQ